MKYGKKYADSVKAFDLTKQYEAAEAVSIVIKKSHSEKLQIPPLSMRMASGIFTLPAECATGQRILYIGIMKDLNQHTMLAMLRLL